jgi:hypothetical protein
MGFTVYLRVDFHVVIADQRVVFLSGNIRGKAVWLSVI